MTWFLLFLTLWTGTAQAADLIRESYYSDKWCDLNNGVREVVLSDLSRVDCSTMNYVVETEYAHKWAEAIGQALHYSAVTQKRAMILLIFKEGKDEVYLERLKEAIRYHSLPIKVVLIPRLSEDK